MRMGRAALTSRPALPHRTIDPHALKNPINKWPCSLFLLFCSLKAGRRDGRQRRAAGGGSVDRVVCAPGSPHERRAIGFVLKKKAPLHFTLNQDSQRNQSLRIVPGAQTQTDCRRFVPVGKWMVRKSDGTSGNTSSNLCAVLLKGSFIEPPSKTEPSPERRQKTFVGFLPRLCRWGFQTWITGCGLNRLNRHRFSLALTNTPTTRQRLSGS